MSEFKPYPAYKDSGVDWLGAVPDIWESKRLKFLFSMVKRDVREEDRIVTCFRDGAVTLRDNRRTDGFTNALKEIGYQGIRVGDLVIHAMDAFAGAIGVSDSDGKSSPVYSVCTPVSSSVSASYYARLLRNMALAGFVTSLAKGIRERSTDFRWADAGEIFLPVPSEIEQKKIVAFLDHETARIDALIEEQQRLIEMLKEKRQAVISNAVTKGLDPTMPMKDSGVEWLGEVPAHWVVGPLRWYATIQGGIAKGKDYEGRETVLLPYLRVANVQNGFVDLSELKEISVLESEVERYSLRSGDVLMNEGGDNDKLGRGTVWQGQIEPCLHQNHVFAIRPNDLLSAEWLATFTQCDQARRYFFLSSKQSTNLASISASNVMSLALPIPPVAEQKEILSILNQSGLAHKELVNLSNSTVEFLKERRAALISAAVTGKIDVRGWQLPASAPSTELVQEAV